MPNLQGHFLLVAALVLAPSARLPAQVPARWSACRMDSLATWNCASYYSGTVTLQSELRGTGIHQSFRVEAIVTDGRVRCRISGTESGDFEGPGMLVVEPSDTDNDGEYGLRVWCPESADEPVRRRDSPLIMVQDQRASDFGLLRGTDAHEHPDADAVNGLSGTETITWELRRR